jgi:hypothetical protein
MLATPGLCWMKDAERNLPRFLLSVRMPTCDSIVSATGASHGAPPIAARYLVEVIPFDFTIVDFAATRQLANV